MKVWFHRDLMNKDPKERKKIKGIIFEMGYECGHSCWCEYGSKCKYRGSYRFHNACVSITNFFHYTLGWKWFHIPFYFQRHHSDLSGTTKCPKGVPRVKNCWHCESCAGDFCNNKKRNEMLREGKFKELEGETTRACILFSPDDSFFNYDKTTGDYIY